MKIDMNMKSLKESLFDKDLVTSDLPVETILKKLENIDNITSEEIIELYETLFNTEKIYNENQIKKRFVDLKDNILLVRRTKSSFADVLEPLRYILFFIRKGVVYCTVYMPASPGNKYSYWNTSNFTGAGRSLDTNINKHWWDKFIRLVSITYRYSDLDYVILPKNISEKFYKSICKKHIF